jgi:hypothetical protein
VFYTDQTKEAIRIAYDAHKEQTDETGMPYVFHLFHLAEQMKDEVSVCAALLQDVFGTGFIAFEGMEARGISPAVIGVLKLLFQDDNTPYLDYIQRIKDSGNMTAISVKLTDLRHRSYLSRYTPVRSEGEFFGLESYDEKVYELLDRYQAAMDILERREASGKLYIDKEAASGTMVYVLRSGGTDLCRSGNLSYLPGSSARPIQTTETAGNKTYSTHRNPAYEGITPVPGLKLEYLVYAGESPKPVAKMKRDYGKNGCFDRYGVYGESGGVTIITVENREPPDATALNQVPDNEVRVYIYPDEAFLYDARSLVEARYIVSVAEKHLRLLPHIFHFYMLRMTV